MLVFESRRQPRKTWAGLLYLTAISQFIGFFFYYKGLALGGIAKMSQVQLLLPFLAIFAAHWILGEQIDGSVIVGTLAITAIVVAGGKSVSAYRRIAVHRTLNEPNVTGRVALPACGRRKEPLFLC